jgi:hypothetical protein
MLLFLISPKDPNDKHISVYDNYESAVVAAETHNDAKKIHPSGDDKNWNTSHRGDSTWVKSPADVKSKLIGVAKTGTKRGVVHAAFNAG